MIFMPPYYSTREPVAVVCGYGLDRESYAAVKELFGTLDSPFNRMMRTIRNCIL